MGKHKKTGKTFFRLSNISSSQYAEKSPCNSKSYQSSFAMTNSSVGISGFKDFIIPSAICRYNCTTMLTDTHNTNKSLSTFANDIGNCSKAHTAISLLHPNILRHRRNDVKSKLILSPKKSLTFSPSKFFNKGLTKNSLKIKSGSTELSYNETEFEDSGIVVSEPESILTSACTPLTSTPSSQSRQKSFQCVDKSCSRDEVVFDHPAVLSATQQSAESIYRTAAPLVLGNISCSPLVLESNYEYECFHNFSNKIFSEYDLNLSDLINCNAEAQSTSLELSSSYHQILFNHANFDTKCNLCLMAGNIIEEKANESLCPPTNLNKLISGYVAEKTKKGKIQNLKLTDRWVSVACGQTYDQLVMTAAAKDCLNI